MTLTFKANYDYCEINPSNGISLRPDATFENKLKTVVLLVPAGVTSFDLEFKNTNSSNCRVDNFMLVAGASKMKEEQIISFGDNKNIEWTIGSDCTLNEAKQGPTVSGAMTEVSYSSSNTSVATVDNDGKVTPLKAGSVTITATAEATDDYKEATDSYSLTIVDPSVVTETYTFTSKSWAATLNGEEANWNSGKDGNLMQSGRGVQITTGASGANATTKSSFNGVSQVVVTYSTNAKDGAGSISIQVGSNTAHSQSVTKTGGTTDRTLTYGINPAEAGNVKITITCTTNSIYVKSVAITHN